MARADAEFVVDDGPRLRRVVLSSYLTAELAESARHEANAWIKSLRHVRVGGQPLRDRFTYRGDSLWWFAELYLHKMQTVDTIMRTLLALEELVRVESPVGLRVARGSVLVRQLARRVAERSGIAWLGGASLSAPGLWARARVVLRAWTYTVGDAIARLSWPQPSPVPPVRVAGFVHTAFWRGDEEQYIGPILRELAATLPEGALALVGLGPQTSYRARSWRHRVAKHLRREASGWALTPVDAYASPQQLRPSQEFWRRRRSVLAEFEESEDLRRAAIIRGCDAWPFLHPLLAGVAYLQFPWSARVMDQIGAAIDALAPRVVVTYAEAGAWGRALVLEARRRGICSVGLQHGFIYRHWLNYLHADDEMRPSPASPADRGFPYPTLTLLYDEFAARHLRTAGGFPDTALAVTGSARLDTLVAQANRMSTADVARVREAVGAGAHQHLVVVAAKFTQIARVFPDLVSAVADMPDVRLVVKCHPAERPDPYLAVEGGAALVSIAPAWADLASLTRSARLLVTVNSTAAIEAMVMGVPSLVLALPNNLSPFVEAGAMAGVTDREPIGEILRRLLLDEDVRRALGENARAFMARNAIASDGRAAERAARHILTCAGALRNGIS